MNRTAHVLLAMLTAILAIVAESFICWALIPSDLEALGLAMFIAFLISLGYLIYEQEVVDHEHR